MTARDAYVLLFGLGSLALGFALGQWYPDPKFTRALDELAERERARIEAHDACNTAMEALGWKPRYERPPYLMHSGDASSSR